MEPCAVCVLRGKGQTCPFLSLRVNVRVCPCQPEAAGGGAHAARVGAPSANTHQKYAMILHKYRESRKLQLVLKHSVSFQYFSILQRLHFVQPLGVGPGRTGAKMRFAHQDSSLSLHQVLPPALFWTHRRVLPLPAQLLRKILSPAVTPARGS